MSTQYTLAGSAARTTTGGGTIQDTMDVGNGRRPDARAYLNVTAHAGTTPTLDVDLTTTIEGVDVVVASFAQVTTTDSVTTINITNCPRDLKAEWTIGGASPSYTFSVILERF